MGSMLKPMSKSGRRPRFSEWKPTQGENAATKIWGTMIRTDIQIGALDLIVVARLSPMSGSIEASAS
jgi:hypothetical protein